MADVVPKSLMGVLLKPEVKESQGAAVTSRQTGERSGGREVAGYGRKSRNVSSGRAPYLSFCSMFRSGH